MNHPPGPKWELSKENCAPDVTPEMIEVGILYALSPFRGGHSLSGIGVFSAMARASSLGAERPSDSRPLREILRNLPSLRLSRLISARLFGDRTRFKFLVHQFAKLHTVLAAGRQKMSIDVSVHAIDVEQVKSIQGRVVNFLRLQFVDREAKSRIRLTERRLRHRMHNRFRRIRSPARHGEQGGKTDPISQEFQRSSNAPSAWKRSGSMSLRRKSDVLSCRSLRRKRRT